MVPEVSGHFSGSISFEKKWNCNRMFDKTASAGFGGAYPSPAFSEKHTVRQCSQLVWVADAER